MRSGLKRLAVGIGALLVVGVVGACGQSDHAKTDQSAATAPGPTAAERRARARELERQRVHEKKLEAAQARREAAQRAARRAAEKQRLLNAPTIAYSILNKNADAYSGKAFRFTGKVLQAQEAGSTGIMLLSVTNQGYGVYADNVWVDYKAPISYVHEGAIVTVHGIVTGSKSYKTQIGGETYVPQIDGKIITKG